MATIEISNKDSFNSNCEGKLLLDELMSTPGNNEHMYISYNTVFTYVNGKTHYDNICKLSADAICENNKKRFKQKLMFKSEVKGGKLRVC